MFNSQQVYEIYRHPSLPEEEAAMFVRRGFAIWAFIFHIGWLLYHRLWIEAAVFTALFVGAVMLGQHYGLSEVAIGGIQLALQVWLAVSAADVEAGALERRGFVLEDVATGASALEAERRYYYSHERHA